MNIWIAIISHRHGTNGYAGSTREDVKEKVYAYVAENWELEDMPGELPSDIDQAIEKYFDSVEGESVEYSEVDFAVDVDAVTMKANIKQLRDALARVLEHADSELEQRQTSGNDEEFAELETDCEKAHEALRATAIYEAAAQLPASAANEGESGNACRTCGDGYAPGGDGFDGECPSCADKTDIKLNPQNHD
jgi:rubrerythrin